MFKKHLWKTLFLIVAFLVASCVDPDIPDIPTEFYLDTNSAVKAGLDHNTLQAFADINETIAGGAKIESETLQMIGDLNNTLQTGALVGLEPNSLATIDRLTETIGQDFGLSISINPVRVEFQVEPETRNWITDLIVEHAPSLASKLLNEVPVVTSQASDEVKNDIIEILQEAEKNFSEMVSLVGVEGRCNVDFLSGRVDNTLNQAIDSFVARITASRINTILGVENTPATITLPKAVICQINPAPLALVYNGNSLIPTEQFLDIVGYDFLEGNLPNIRVYTTDESEFARLTISRPSNYQMQVNLQTVDFGDVGFGAQIVLDWPDGERNSIPVLQPAPTPVPTPIPTTTSTPTVEPCPVAMIDEPDGLLDVLTGPGIVYDMIGQLPNGPSPCIVGYALSVVTSDVDPSTGQRTKWWAIEFGGQRGWVRSTYASLDCPEDKCPPEPPPPTPVPPPPTSTPIPPPVADFQCGPTQGIAPLTINCVDRSTNNPTDWLWDFGDDSVSNNPNPSHTYNSAGNFTIKLTVTNNQGSSTKEATISVSTPPPPTPTLTPTPPPPPQTLMYTFVPSPIRSLCPDRINGDREFDGNGPNVTASAVLFVKNSRELWVRLTLRARETKSDWSEAYGEWEIPLWGIPVGFEIINVLPNQPSTTQYVDDNHQLDIPSISGSALVKRFEINGDTGGNDIGNCTNDDVYMNAYFNEVQVIYRED